MTYMMLAMSISTIFQLQYSGGIFPKYIQQAWFWIALTVILLDVTKKSSSSWLSLERISLIAAFKKLLSLQRVALMGRMASSNSLYLILLHLQEKVIPSIASYVCWQENKIGQSLKVLIMHLFYIGDFHCHEHSSSIQQSNFQGSPDAHRPSHQSWNWTLGHEETWISWLCTQHLIILSVDIPMTVSVTWIGM